MESFSSKRVVTIIGLGCLAVSWLVYSYWPVPVEPGKLPSQSLVEELRETLGGGPSKLSDASPDAASSAAPQPPDRVARARAASKLGALRDEDSMPLLLEAMEDPDPLIRGRAGVAVQKIMKADYYFRAEDPPHRRAETLAEIRRVWEGYLRHKKSSADGGR